jgi:DNA-nicking Smr family endonuclease
MRAPPYSPHVARKPRETPFNDAFGKLRERIEPRPPARTTSRPPPPPAPTPPAPPRERTDDELWAEAVSGVTRAAPGPARVEAPAPVPSRTLPGEFWHPDLDALRELEALVSGAAPFDLADSDEFIEGRVPGLDPAIVRRLRRGEFAVQGHADLHGMTREEAKAAVDAFLLASRRAGKRCVLLVHGRGIHSKDQVPILKEALKSWLATARFGRHVLAFATARPADGGAGAVYVLLRRAGR